MAAVAGVGLAASLVQTLFSALQSNQQVRSMCTMFKCESELEQLEGTVSTIKALLLDVDQRRQGLTHEGQLWVERLKDAVYDIDDLLDEFATIGQQHWHAKKLSKKVHAFFSRNNKYLRAFIVSRDIKMLRENLDAIAKDHRQFGLKVVSDHVERRPETWSFMSDQQIVGRDDDKAAILGMLLAEGSHSSNRNVSFVTIVGMGGLGKTALAQLVYNDEKVKQAFSERFWVCVSEDFGLKQILAKILRNNKEATLEAMKEDVRTLLQSKKYLLVLDDVWNESPGEWLNLKSSLLDMVSNVSGSKIIVTTRSKKVATSIGDKDPNLYELQGLSEENSWKLFARLAFGESEEHVDRELVDIGKDIVKRCANVPLSIRVIATLLYKQDKSKWLSFKNFGLAEMCHDQDSIMPTLMFSYYELPTDLKCCFSFCSLFPKDYVIEKELLISLWLAQGFLAKIGNAEESMEDVGERYFTILLNRCFFQDIILDRHDDVCSFKMHDLMHDLAVQVAGKETFILTPSSGAGKLGNKIRHLSSYYASSSPNMCLSNTLRTYIWLKVGKPHPHPKVSPIVSKCKRLRVLSLYNFKITPPLPDELGKLLHLRYLDLSCNGDLVMLPKSVTKLHNLQILKLGKCKKLKELPEDMSKLVNLRTLDIQDCMGLRYMPKGMNNMKNLHTLTEFVVGGVDTNQVQGGKLEDLQGRSLKGDLLIRIRNFSSQHMPCATKKRAFILKDARLKYLGIRCGNFFCDKLKERRRSDFGRTGVDEFDQGEVHQTLVEDLCPNEDIISFGMLGYEGSKLPSWASMMVPEDMNERRHVTSLSRFHNLKVLRLGHLANVEYMEIASEAASALALRGRESMTTFFPFLEELLLHSMPKLKGWWKGLRWSEGEGRGGCLVDDADGSISADEFLPCFPRLRDMKIRNCKRMKYFPPCPQLKRLCLREVNDELTFCMKGGASSSNMPASSFCLEELSTDNARSMNSVLRGFVGGAIDMKLKFEPEVKSMGIVKEGFERLGSVLKKLQICYGRNLDMKDEDGMPWKSLQSLCSLILSHLPKMVKLPEGFQHLTSLQSLHISSCVNLEEVGSCIGSLTSLQSLIFRGCPKLKALPECIGSLTSLQSLVFIGCPKLNALPECIGSLTSLQSLEIYESELKSIPESMRHLTSLTKLEIWSICDELVERCQEDGEDWPKICHIPNRHVSVC